MLSRVGGRCREHDDGYPREPSHPLLQRRTLQLPDVLGDAARQQVPFAEVLCYDDGSADDTGAVAARLGARVLRGAVNRGAAYARNRLIEACGTPWLHFHDADDRIAPDFVERMSEAARDFDGAVLCAMSVVHRESGKTRDVVTYGPEATTDPVRYFLLHTGFGIVGLYPRHRLLAIGGFREDLRGNEDADLHVRLAGDGCPFRVVREPLVTNLVHSQSSSSVGRTVCMIDALRCLESYADDLPGCYGADIACRAASLAWLLYEVGERRWARRGIALARRLDRAGTAPQHPLMRAVARFAGLEAAFALKRAAMRFRS